MSSVVISGDTSGAITLSAPAVSGTNTATLPAATGTVMVSGNMPAFSAYKNTNQTLSNATTTKVTFQVENFDTANCFDNTTNYRFTPTVAGYYQINATVLFNASAINRNMVYILFLYKNGAVYLRQQMSINGNTSTYSDFSGVINNLVFMNGSTDYLEIYAYIGDVTLSNGGDIAGALQYTQFSGSLVRAA